MLWPSPEPFTLTVHGGRLMLPAPDPQVEVAAPELPPVTERSPDTRAVAGGPAEGVDADARPRCATTENRHTHGWEKVWDGGRTYGSGDTWSVIADDDPGAAA